MTRSRYCQPYTSRERQAYRRESNCEETTRLRRSIRPPRPSAIGTRESPRPLLILLLPLRLDVPFPLLAPEFRRALPLELIPVDRQLVLDGEAVIHPRQLPLGGERQSAVLQLQVFELCLVLVRPAHRPGEVVPVFLDLQGGCPLLP